MILLDVNNNRPIMDGNTVFLGDQVLIDIKASIKGLKKFKLNLKLFLFKKINF